MAIEVKRKMLQREYAWKAVKGDDPQARKTDARLLNRNEGYEVLPMIQEVVDHFGYGGEDDVQKIEALIRDELPGTVRGRKRVFDWLVERLESERAREAAAKEVAAKRAAAKKAAAKKAAAKKKKVPAKSRSGAAGVVKVGRRMLQREYVWEAARGDDPKSRVIDARFLNRHEGYEVIPMIQKVVDHFGYGSEDDVQNIEALIRDELPGNVRGRKRVFDWLVDRLESERAAAEKARAAAEKAAAEKAAAEKAAAEKAAAERAAALEAKWRVPETWGFSYDEMKKKVAVYAAFDEVARRLASGYEATGELPATFSSGDDALAHGSDRPVEIRISRYDCDRPPVGTYNGHVEFDAEGSDERIAFRLDLEHTKDGATGTTESGR